MKTYKNILAGFLLMISVTSAAQPPAVYAARRLASFFGKAVETNVVRTVAPYAAYSANAAYNSFTYPTTNTSQNMYSPYGNITSHNTLNRVGESPYERMYNDAINTNLKQSVSASYITKSKKNAKELITHVNSNLAKLGIVGFSYNPYLLHFPEINHYALESFNRLFHRTAGTLWDGKADKIVATWMRKAAFIRKSSWKVLEENKIYHIDNIEKNVNVYLVEESNRFYLISFKKGKSGNSGEIMHMSEGAIAIIAAQFRFGDCLKATKQRDVKYLYLSAMVSQKKYATIMVNFEGKEHTIKLTGDDLYAVLLANIKSIVGTTPPADIILCLDRFEKCQPESNPSGSPLLAINAKDAKMFLVSHSRLVHDLQMEIESNFYIGNHYKSDAAKVKTLPSTLSIADTQLIVPDKSFDDKGYISRPTLDRIRDNGLPYILVENEIPLELSQNILVFSGHNGAELWNFLETIGSAGLLKDKILVMYSCNDGNDIYKYSDLIERYGIRNILRFPYRVDPGAVKAVLLKIGKHLGNENFQDIWRKAAEAAYWDPDPSFALLKEEIKKLFDFQYLISSVVNKPTKYYS